MAKTFGFNSIHQGPSLAPIFQPNPTAQWNRPANPDIAAQGEQARQLAEQQEGYRNSRFNQIMPMFQSGMSGSGGVAQGNFTAAAPSISRPNMGPAPVIPGGPIYSEQAIRQNVNANNARVDQGTASNNMNMAGQLAGQGFGARSPLTRALEQMGSQSAMGQKADYGRQFTQTAREQNANFGLQAGQARERQFAARAQEDLGYGNLENQRYSTLQNALNQQLAAAQSGQNAQTQSRTSLMNALLSLAG